MNNYDALSNIINGDSKDIGYIVFNVPIDSKLGIPFQTSSFEMMTELSSILTISLLIHNINELLFIRRNPLSKIIDRLTCFLGSSISLGWLYRFEYVPRNENANRM